MEIVIEFLGELIGEIIIGGAFEIIDDVKTPKWLRKLLLGVMSVFYTGFAGFLIWVGIQSESGVLKGLMIFVALIFLACFVHLWYKVLKSRKRAS